MCEIYYICTRTYYPQSNAMKNLLFLALLLIVQPVTAQQSIDNENKQAVIRSVENQSDALINLSDRIWEYAEIAFRENQSSEALASYAEEQGFRVTRGVGEIPTAFTAEYGSGKPVIGILGEFDALPGLSQKKIPHKEPMIEGEPGHGCGHNLFGVASLGAATSIKELIESGGFEGTIRFYGTPAEEKFFGKLWMIRAGLFDDVDVVMDWHPGDETEADVQSSLALVDFLVEYYGQAAHASSDPWNGRSASDALELYTDGINMYREHIKPTVRIHYHIQDAGKVVNVVPDYAKIWTRVRDTRREGMQEVWNQVEKIAEGAAMMANVDYKITLISGIHEVLPNRTGGAALQKNLEALGTIDYTQEEENFAKQIQQATNSDTVGIDMKINPLKETAEHPMGGSTDVGDVSFIAPTIRLSVTTAPKGTPWHSWAVVATGGMSIGHKGMVYASKALAMTMVDLFENPELVNEIQAEFKEKKGDYEYEGMIPPGPPPLDFEQ